MRLVGSKPSFYYLEVTLADSKRKTQFPRREVECIIYLCCGFSHKEIAKRLKLSPRTVQFYLHNASVRLGSQNTLGFKHDILASNFLDALLEKMLQTFICQQCLNQSQKCNHESVI